MYAQEYINEGQPSPYELTFGVELGLNSHSKIKKQNTTNWAFTGSFIQYWQFKPLVVQKSILEDRNHFSLITTHCEQKID